MMSMGSSPEGNEAEDGLTIAPSMFALAASGLNSGEARLPLHKRTVLIRLTHP